MRLPYIFIFALLCNALAQEFALPNLNVNTDDGTCDNAQDLLTAAQADLARLTKFVNQDLVDAKADADNAICLTKRSCNVAVVGPASTMLQAQKSSKLNKNSMNALQDFSHTLESQERSDLYKLLIADKFDDAVGMMLEISSSSEQADNVYDHCTDTIARLQTLSSYLDSVGQQVTTQYIDSYLPQRIDYINGLLAQCSNSPITQTGTVQRTYWSTASPMVGAPQTVRVDDFKVTFPQAFDVVPSVGIALTGNDMNQGTPLFQVEATDAATDSFNLRVTAPSGVGINMVQISYIATISARSGIYITTNSIDNTVDADVQTLSTAPQGDTPRVVTRTITPPSNLANVQSFAVIRDYNVQPGHNARFSVATSSDSTSVSYQAYQDSLINAVTSTIVFWNGNDGSITPNTAEIQKSGPLSQGAGARTSSFEFDISAYSAPPEFFFGLYQYELYENSGYRVKESFTVADSTLTFNFIAWYYTQVDWVRSNLLFACKYSDKSKCLR